MSSEVGESVSMESPVVIGWTHVSAMTKIREGVNTYHMHTRTSDSVYCHLKPQFLRLITSKNHV